MTEILSPPQIRAEVNFHNRILTNSYPGRVIVCGLDETGEHLVQLYAIMGRSENSRNRVFLQDAETGRLYTEAADPSKVKDPSLIIYNAMCEVPDVYVVSNGGQTDEVIRKFGTYDVHPTLARLSWALGDYSYEPDPPNHTPRITAVFREPFDGRLEMAVLRKSHWSDACDRCFYEYADFESGFGHCLTTYTGDANPLPPFHGEPLLMPLAGSQEQILEKYWEALYEENRVSLAVKFISRETGKSRIVIENKYVKVA